jgi:hypothetical protein
MTSLMPTGQYRYMMSQAEAPACVRCGREVRVSREQYEVFERMHYVCFHYEFEHDPFDPDEECAAGGCPSFRFDAPPPSLRDTTG